MSDRPAPAEVHISSLVVHLRPDCREAARQRIAMFPGIELHGGDTGGAQTESKLVVVLETPSEAEILTRMAAINDIPGVVATSLIYHEIDNADREEDQDA